MDDLKYEKDQETRDEEGIEIKYGEPSLEQKTKIPVKYIISYKDIRKKRWNIFIMSLAIWNGFFIPFDFAFKPAFAEHWAVVMLTLFVDICFVTDLVLGFFTTFLDNRGLECFDSN